MRAATSRVKSSPSITQGPAMITRGESLPIVISAMQICCVMVWIPSLSLTVKKRHGNRRDDVLLADVKTIVDSSFGLRKID